MKSIFPFVKVFWTFYLLAVCLPSFSQERGLKAMNDTIDLYPGVPVVYDILANDTIPADDTIKNVFVGGTGLLQCQKAHDSTWKWVFTFTVPSWGYGGDTSFSYRLLTMSLDTNSAKILFRIHDKSYSYLDINNVRARFNSSGNHFFYEDAEYEVPKGSGITTIFTNALWIGGKDGQGQLHFAGERYGQGSTGWTAHTKHDFYAGPIMDSINYSIYQDTIWNYIWNLKKTDIDYHKAHYWDPGYLPIHDILTWPGNGDTSLGQAQRLAPFSDRNADGTYNPYDGDYPEIRGDQALFFIFNDGRDYHSESTGAKLHVEIHGMAYAFDMPDDSAFKNTVFLNYKFYNRSQNTYDSTLLGIFTDIDLGYPDDDYDLCDVERNMFIGYNGTQVDGYGQSYAYGESPPAQAVTLLGGPYMDADGIDNPRYDLSGNQLCDFSVNGVNFGDTIIDNERFGLQKFLYFNNSGGGVPAYMTDPNYAAEYYLFLNGIWKDNSHMIYGGNAHFGSGGYGPDCNFMFPGESDTLNWGVGCVPPNGPVNWTEETAGNNPSDRRGLQVTGPFTFIPGEMQEVDLMFNWARAYGAQSPMASVDKLRQMADQINSAFTINQLPNGNPFYGIGDQRHPSGFLVKIFPNPSLDHLNIIFENGYTAAGTTIELMNSQGKCIKEIIPLLHRNSVIFDVSDIPSGFYFIRLTTTELPIVKKVVVIH